MCDIKTYRSKMSFSSLCLLNAIALAEVMPSEFLHDFPMNFVSFSCAFRIDFQETISKHAIFILTTQIRYISSMQILHECRQTDTNGFVCNS